MISDTMAMWVIVIQSLIAYWAVKDAWRKWPTEAVLPKVVIGFTIVILAVYLWVRIGWSWWLPPLIVAYLITLGLIELIEVSIRHIPPFHKG